MSKNYIVNNHKPTAVTHCVSGSFTGSNDLNLILAKSTYLEIYLVTSEGLKLLKEFAIYGKIVSLQLFKTWVMSNSNKSGSSIYKQNLFILTHKYNVCILECQKDCNDVIQISTRAYGNMQEKIGRPSETGMIASIDPEGQVIGLRLYDGLYKVIHLTEQKFNQSSGVEDTFYGGIDGNNVTKNEMKAFNVNIEERKIIDMTFLEGFEAPTLALINQDSEGRHFRTYKLGLYERDLIRGPWNENNIEAEASILIPIPVLLGGGVVIVGQESIMYYRGDNASSFAIRPPIMKQSSITCFAKIDPNGSRYLLGDMAGRMFMLLLETLSDDNKSVRGVSPSGTSSFGGHVLSPVMPPPYSIVCDMRLEYLGEISIPECLTYLDNAVIYVGSKLGDSQLIRLRSTPLVLEYPHRTDVTNTTQSMGALLPADSLHTKEVAKQHHISYLEILETFTNLGPIVDMIVVDPEKSGHKDQLITCSGAFKEGSLRVLRDGIGFTQLAALELPSGVRGLWTLKNSVTRADSYLVIAFSDLTTRVIAFETSVDGIESDGMPGSGGGLPEETLEEIDMPGLVTQGTTTLWCGDVHNNNILQVTTTHGCRLLDRINSKVLREWFIPGDEKNDTPNDNLTPTKVPGTVPNRNINLAACNKTQLLIASGPDLYYLEITKNDLVLRSSRKFMNEISCINVNPLPHLTTTTISSDPNVTHEGPPIKATTAVASLFCAVGFWTNITVQILGPLLPPTCCCLDTLCEESLPKTDVIPRSIVMCYFKDDEDERLEGGAASNSGGDGPVSYSKLQDSNNVMKEDRNAAAPGSSSKTSSADNMQVDEEVMELDDQTDDCKNVSSNNNNKLLVNDLEIVNNDAAPAVKLTPAEESIAKGCFLLVALGDGTIYYFTLHPGTGQLSERKKFNAGTRPPALKLIGGVQTSGFGGLLNMAGGHRGGNLPNGLIPTTSSSASASNNYTNNLRAASSMIQQQNVLICSDRPAIVYRRNRKLIVSDVNVDEISFATPFDSASYPDSLILVPSPASGLIIIGKIDEIRKLHIKTIPLYESPRRVTYQESTQTFGVICVRVDVHNGTTFVPPSSTSGGECVSIRAPKHSSVSTFGSVLGTSGPTAGSTSALLGPGGGHSSKTTPAAAASHHLSSTQHFTTSTKYLSFDANSNVLIDRTVYVCSINTINFSTMHSLGMGGTNNTPSSGTYGDEMESHSLVILDSHTFEPLWAHHFQPFEFATSLISCQLAISPDDSSSPSCLKEYYVVGTAMVYPEDAEPKAGKIIIFEYGYVGDTDSNQRKNNNPTNTDLQDLQNTNRCLSLVSEKEISGAPYSLCQFPSSETTSVAQQLLSTNKVNNSLVVNDINTVGDTSNTDNLTLQRSTGGAALSTLQQPNPAQSPKLLVSVNSTVRLFEWFPQDKELRLECSHFNNILALYLKTRGDFILVGDLMRSLTLLNYKPLEGNFEEVARDYNPSWTSAIEIMDNACETFIAADNSFNLFVCRTKDEYDDRNQENLTEDGALDIDEKTMGNSAGTSARFAKDSSSGRKRRPSVTSPTSISGPSTTINNLSPATAVPSGGGAPPSATLLDDERRYLYPTAVYHLAEFTNVIRHGILVSKNITIDSTFDIGKSLLLGTISGSVHLVLQLPSRIYSVLERLQHHMAKQLPTLGKMNHTNFHAFHTQQKSEKSRGFIDGDLIESFLDLEILDKNRIFDKLSSDLSLLNKAKISTISASKHLKLESPAAIGDINGQYSKLISTDSIQPTKFSLSELTKIIEELARLH